MGQIQGQDDATAKVAGAELIPAIIHEFLPLLTPGLPVPKVLIVSNPGAAYLARCIWIPGENNTTLKVQKSVLGDETTLRRIIAHELCHHDEFLSRLAPMPKNQRDLLMRVEGGHGAYFKKLADKFNARFGPDFVSEKSDSAMVEDDGRTYLVLLRKKPATGQIAWAWALKPSQRQREYINGVLHEGRVNNQEVNPADYKLVHARDTVLAQGPTIGRGMATTWDEGVNAKLRKLWEEAPALAKVGALISNVIDTNGEEIAQIELRPKFGFHYRILVVKGTDGVYTGEMHREGQEFIAPPFRLEAKSIGDLTRNIWEILDEGYRIKMDAARRAADRTLMSQLHMENLRNRQDSMADVERAFRKMPREHRQDWSKPWSFHVEGSVLMADMRRATTRQQFVDRFAGMFPEWSVNQTATELVAMSPDNMSWEQVDAASRKLKALSQEMRVALVSRSARGRFVVTVDLTGLR